MNYPVGDFEYKINICDHILDNVYGQIGLTEVEKKIERLPIFKRLHSLSQLGLVNWIFPCALHTRYVHSIGVMHVASQMAEHININAKNSFFNDNEIQILRLTGLLHDIGHYPLSHNVEHAYQDSPDLEDSKNKPISENLKHYVNCPDFLHPDAYVPTEPEEIKNKKLSDEEDFFKKMSGSMGYHHEAIGKTIIIKNEEIKDIIQNNFVLLEIDGCKYLNPFFAPKTEQGESVREIEEQQLEEIVKVLLLAIGEMICGNYSYTADQNYPWLEKYSAMIQIIHSDLDADNIDYLLRDATFSGTSYGVMDMGILLNSLCVQRLTVSDSYNIGCSYKYLIGVKKKGVGSVEQFFLNKYLAYTQMIFSKFVSILEAMLYYLMSENIIQTSKNYRNKALDMMISQKETDLNYLAFTDNFVLNSIFNLASFGGLNELSSAIISRLSRSCAFDLYNKSEFICTGTDRNTIKKEFEQNPLYKEFINVYNSLKDQTGKQIKHNNTESQLFAFRFEEYSLTKQEPLELFKNRFVFDGMGIKKRFNCCYYRLANGVPVLDSDKSPYFFEEDVNGIVFDKMPPLCVDIPRSSLKHICSMKFVSLRKYDISEYSK